MYGVSTLFLICPPGTPDRPARRREALAPTECTAARPVPPVRNGCQRPKGSSDLTAKLGTQSSPDTTRFHVHRCQEKTRRKHTLADVYGMLAGDQAAPMSSLLAAMQPAAPAQGLQPPTAQSIRGVSDPPHQGGRPKWDIAAAAACVQRRRGL